MYTSRREHLEQTVGALGNPANPEEVPYLVDYRIARERSTNLLQIRIKQISIRNSMQMYMRTWHNIRTIRLRTDERRALYTLEFIGSDAYGIQVTFSPPTWAFFNHSVFGARAEPAFERLGLTKLTLHETPSVLEFSA
jgi:hypothetical protein